MTLSQAILKEFLEYDCKTGVFTRLISRRSDAKAGSIAGSVDNCGYIRIKIEGRAYKAHRLAWLYVNGSFPAEQIDHINRCRSDNRIANLRLASRSQNAANRVALSTNTSGIKGVSWDKGSRKWKAQISYRNKKISLGVFVGITDAKAAYDRAAAELFGEYARVT